MYSLGNIGFSDSENELFFIIIERVTTKYNDMRTDIFQLTLFIQQDSMSHFKDEAPTRGDDTSQAELVDFYKTHVLIQSKGTTVFIKDKQIKDRTHCPLTFSFLNRVKKEKERRANRERTGCVGSPTCCQRCRATNTEKTERQIQMKQKERKPERQL